MSSEKKSPLRCLGPCVAALLVGAPQSQDRTFTAQVVDLAGATVLTLEDGRRVRLQGLTLPAEVVRPPDFERRLAAFLRSEVVGRRIRVTTDPTAGSAPAGELVGVVRGAAADASAPSVNERALEAGLAVFGCRTPQVGELQRLLAAARRAQRDSAGWFADSPLRLPERIPYLNGAVLGLYYKKDSGDYRRQIDALAEAGFTHVSLLLTAMIADVRAHRIDRNHDRTVPDARLIETIGLARAKGMSVMLLPIVLLEDAGDDDWRGTLRPADEAAFWLEYDAFLAHYLDIAAVTGVTIFSVGSELGSLEDRDETWRRLIQNARGRFNGWLTYSANWDHVHAPRFFGLLDLVGLTGYFSLTAKDDPTRDELAAAWRRVGRELRAIVGKLGKPVVITELGYASQDGTNRDPWNYVINTDEIDLAEQADCFAAFMQVAPSLEFLHGAYFFDVFDPGGPSDPGYSPRRKPAWELWRRWAAYRPVSASGR